MRSTKQIGKSILSLNVTPGVCGASHSSLSIGIFFHLFIFCFYFLLFSSLSHAGQPVRGTFVFNAGCIPASEVNNQTQRSETLTVKTYKTGDRYRGKILVVYSGNSFAYLNNQWTVYPEFGAWGFQNQYGGQLLVEGCYDWGSGDFSESQTEQELGIYLESHPFLAWNNDGQAYCPACTLEPIEMQYKIYDWLSSYDEELTLSEQELTRDLTFWSVKSYRLGDFFRFKFTARQGDQVAAGFTLTDAGVFGPGEISGVGWFFKRILYDNEGNIAGLVDTGNPLSAGDHYLDVWGPGALLQDSDFSHRFPSVWPCTFSRTGPVSGRVTLKLIPQKPDIAVTDSTPPGDANVSFGNVGVGDSAEQTVTISNTGEVDLVIGNVATADPLAAPFSIVADACSGKSLAPGVDCTLTVRFSPSAEGPFDDTFDIPSNDPDENPGTIFLNGTGVDFIVNTAGDESDADPNDNACDVNLSQEGSQCTLRAALEGANRRSGDHTIIFDIPGGGTPVITPASPLPPITQSITIDGTTQFGGQVVLNGAGAGSDTHGLHITGGDYAIVKGFAIVGFQGNGIFSEVSLASEENPGHYVRVDSFVAAYNGGWGILVSDSIDINYDRAGLVNTTNTFSLFTDNGLGGIRSRNGYVSAYKVETSANSGPGILAGRSILLTDVKSNGNRGPGIQSFLGSIWLKNSPEAANQVIGNQGYGIFSDAPLCGPDSCPQGVLIETAIDVNDNSLWGILADSSVYVNADALWGSGVVAGKVSTISNNGNNGECWEANDRQRGTIEQVVCRSAGGIISQTHSIVANNADVSANKGAGLVAHGDIILAGILSKNNRGPGIYSETGMVRIKECDACPNQVMGNKGHGIFGGALTVQRNRPGAFSSAILWKSGTTACGAFCRKALWALTLCLRT